METNTLVQLIIAALAVVAWGFGMWILNKINQNQNELFDRTDKHDSRITVLETRCEDTHGDSHRRRMTDKPAKA